jgi:hypothetical protein
VRIGLDVPVELCPFDLGAVGFVFVVRHV